MENQNINVDNCPICLDNCSTHVTICKNKHISCIPCIKEWRQSSDTCPVCRSLMVITGKYDPQKHKLQHRFDDSNTWGNYTELDNLRITIVKTMLQFMFLRFVLYLLINWYFSHFL